MKLSSPLAAISATMLKCSSGYDKMKKVLKLKKPRVWRRVLHDLDTPQFMHNHAFNSNNGSLQFVENEVVSCPLLRVTSTGDEAGLWGLGKKHHKPA